MRIEGLKKYRSRPSIDDLPEPQRSKAWNWKSYLLASRVEQGKLTPQTTGAILTGQAKRLAKMTQAELSQWGRTMRATLGGYSVQRMYRDQGRTGDKHPAHKAAQISALRRKQRKQEREETQLRQRLDIPPETRSKWTDLG